MSDTFDYQSAELALRQGGSSWSAAQAHGLLCGQIAASGGGVISSWLNTVIEDTDPANALRNQAEDYLMNLADATYKRLSERQSEFTPLLPDESEGIAESTRALAEWSEGFLHGLVSGASTATVKDRVAKAPIDEIVRDFLEISRAEADDEQSDAADDEAFAELIEYVRVSTQLVYEELAELRHAQLHSNDVPGQDVIH